MKPQVVVGEGYNCILDVWNLTIENIEFLLLIAALGVVAFSIFVQGVTMTPRLRGLKVLALSPTMPDREELNEEK